MNANQMDWDSGQGHQDNVVMIIHRLLRGRYILTIVLALVFGIAGGSLGYMSRQPQFESEGLIRIKPTLPKVLFESEQSVAPKMFSSFVSSQAELIKNGRVIQRAMESDEWRKIDGLTNIQSAFDVQRRLQVRPSRQAQEIIKVSFSDANALVSATVVSAVMRSYIEEYRDEGSIKNPEILGALNKRKEDLTSKRNTLDNQITTIAEKYRTDNLGPLIDNALYTIRLLEAQRNELIDQRDLYTQFQRDGEENPDGLSIEEAAGLDPKIAAMVAREDELENLRDEMMESDGLRMGHRDVQRVTAMIESTQRKINLRLLELRSGDISTPIPGGDGTPVASSSVLEYKISRLDAQIQDAKDQSDDLHGANVRLRTLKDDRANVQDSISVVNARLDQINTETQIQDMGKISIPVFPKASHEPTSDPRKKMAVVGFVGASSLPVMAVLALGFMSHRVQYSDDDILTSAGAGIIGMLPDLGDSLTDHEVAAASAFAVHQLRSQLQIKSTINETQVYSITSPASQDGKTSLIIALGLSFAESGERTLLIDMDFIGRGLSIHFGYPDAPSLAEALSDPDEVDSLVCDTDFENLSILPAGFGDDERISRLSPRLVGGFLDYLRGEFDTILIDSGPILGSVEASFIAPQSDGVILVVGRGQLKPLIKKAIDQIHGVDGEIVATIFNRALIQELRQSSSSMSVHFSRQMSRQQEDIKNKQQLWGGPVAGALNSAKQKKSSDKESVGS